MSKKNPAYPAFKMMVEQKTGLKLEPEYHFYLPHRRWRFDFADVDHKIAIEVEGGVWARGRHTRPAGFLKDIEKYNTATALGWALLRFPPDQLMTIKTLKTIKDTVKQQKKKIPDVKA